MTSQGFASRLRAVSARTWIGVALGILALVFILQNRQDARISILNFDIIAPLWTILLVTLAVGALVGFLLTRHSRVR
ncbi:MAG TPA: DUF1049 domain-containing protein [Amycolatopsis sp.]|nr:DUF1049 domain-containing protein [Amycolatopsis sp.]